MPIFAKGISKDKLTILYYIRSSSIDISRDQLFRAMVENDCIAYFDFQNAMYDLEEDGLIAAIPRSFGQGYRVTARGEETLNLFSDALPHSLRGRLDAYGKENRNAMLLETQLVSTMEEQRNGGYRVELKALEQDTVVAKIDLLVASRSMAQRIRANWPSASEEIYSDILDKLLKKSTGEGTDGDELSESRTE